MKKLIQLIVSLLLSNSAHASLTASPVKDLIDTINATNFTYTETGMAFRFVNIKSCTYTSSDLIVIKNYCSPKKDYPAKGYTIISKKFGLVEFYQEQHTAEILKREIRIDAFPEITSLYLKSNLADQKLNVINNFLETMSAKQDAACWSTNYSYYSRIKEVACYLTDVAEYPAWSEETQSLVLDLKAWNNLIKTLEMKFPR